LPEQTKDGCKVGHLEVVLVDAGLRLAIMWRRRRIVPAWTSILLVPWLAPLLLRVLPMAKLEGCLYCGSKM
jgi:hypothetical protein